MTGFTGRGSARASWHFIGVQVVEAEAFQDLPADEPAESVGGLYPALIRQRPRSIRAHRCRASFVDIGTPADYLATSLRLASEESAGALGPQPPSLIGFRPTIARSARLERTILWDDVEVGAGARITECVLADGVRVPAGAEWTRRAVVPATACPMTPGDERIGDLLLSPIDR